MNLDQLAPPLPPAPVPWWPPAPGWWLLAGLLLAVLVAILLLRRRQPARHAPAAVEPGEDPIRAAALAELAALRRPAPDEPASPWLQALNGLLKRLCRSRYPDDRPHTLTGRAWLAFLDSRCPAAGLTRWMILVDGGYRAECRLDDKASRDLEQAVATWIRRHA